MTQEEVDDIIYIASREAEKFLKSKYADRDFDFEIERHIDCTEESLQLVSHDQVKFNEFLNKFADEKLLSSEFEKYIKAIYPSINLQT